MKDEVQSVKTFQFNVIVGTCFVFSFLEVVTCREFILEM